MVLSITSIFEEIYIFIENNKTPYLFSKLSGDKLDEWGYGVNLPRKTDEQDTNYKYRLKNWSLINETANNTAINAALLDPIHAESIQHIPFTKGCGTASIYVLPKTYDDEEIKASLDEAKSLIKHVISPSIYVEYVVPKKKQVVVYVNYKISSSGDREQIQKNIYANIKEYVNAIVPGDYIYVGHLNKIGMSEKLVEYFSVSNFVIDDKNINSLSVQQEINTKLLLDDIIWIEVMI